MLRGGAQGGLCGAGLPRPPLAGDGAGRGADVAGLALAGNVRCMPTSHALVLTTTWPLHPPPKQELPWRELCRRRWRLAPDDGPALEELRAALPLPSALATWRQVYAFHHRAALPPRGPVTPTLLGPHAANRLLLAHASVNGVAAWLFLGAVPAGPAPALLPFRLLLQNLAHDTALVPYQRLRLVSSSCSMDVDEAPPRARAISNISVGTSLAAASSGSSGSEGEGEDADADGHADVDAFFLDHEEKGDEVPPLPVSKQPKQAAKGGAGPCVVARNERRLDGAARIPWRRFKVRMFMGALSRSDRWTDTVLTRRYTPPPPTTGHGGRPPAPRPLRHGRARPAPAPPRRLPRRHAAPARPAREVITHHARAPTTQHNIHKRGIG